MLQFQDTWIKQTWEVSDCGAGRKTKSDSPSSANSTSHRRLLIVLGAMLVIAHMLIKSENYQVRSFWLTQTLSNRRMKGLEHFVEVTDVDKVSEQDDN